MSEPRMFRFDGKAAFPGWEFRFVRRTDFNWQLDGCPPGGAMFKVLAQVAEGTLFGGYTFKLSEDVFVRIDVDRGAWEMLTAPKQTVIATRTITGRFAVTKEQLDAIDQGTYAKVARAAEMFWRSSPPLATQAKAMKAKSRRRDKERQKASAPVLGGSRRYFDE